MTFRTRLTIAFGLVALVPIVLFGLGVRREMKRRLDAVAERRIASLVEFLRADLAAEMKSTQARLTALGHGLGEDNRFRLAVVAAGDRRWLLDWAAEAARTSGLDVIQLQDSAGRILSSAHFRNDYDRMGPFLRNAAASARGSGVLAQIRTPEGSRRALLGVDSFQVGGNRFSLLGGRTVDSARIAGLARDDEIHVTLELDSAAPSTNMVAEVPLPFVDDITGRSSSARLVVARDLEPARVLEAAVDAWFLAALGVTIVAALAVAALLANRVSRPLAELADKTERVDLDRLDQEFATGRSDEIGALSRLLDRMMARLRAGAIRLRETERRATVGDLARQVNHDIKNGLAPIRHVVRHLNQIAADEPERLGSVYGERRTTLESSVEYLDNLARNYGNLSPTATGSGTDPNPVLRELAWAMAGGSDRVVIETKLAPSIPKIRADEVVLRRILENLVSNAVDSIEGSGGRVVLSSEVVGDTPESKRVRIGVADTGRGMSRDELDRAFDDFFTTKAGGTGLGLSVVRRLVTDLGGSVKAESAPGQGSKFTVEVPVA